MKVEDLITKFLFLYVCVRTIPKILGKKDWFHHFLAGVVCAATSSVDHKNWKYDATEEEVVALSVGWIIH